jgi:hypothetical protein
MRTPESELIYQRMWLSHDWIAVGLLAMFTVSVGWYVIR